VKLTWVLESDLPVAVIRLTGQLDVDTAPDARLALHSGLAAQPAAVLVDLSGLTAADDVVLTAFSAFAKQAAAWPGCPVALCAPTAEVATALDRMAVSRSMRVYPERARAMADFYAVPPPRRYWRRLPSSPAAAALARSTVVAACRAWRLEHLSDRAELIVTELVSNAIVHAKTEMELLVVLREPFLNISLGDGNPAPARLLTSDPSDPAGGRGLILVEALATRWGCLPTRNGKVVWAMLRLDPPRHRGSGNRPSA
jgi:anti-anti-sigma regulatory factor